MSTRPVTPRPRGDAIELRRLGYFKGCAHGMRQASLAVQVRLLQAWPLERERALRQRLAGDEPEPAPGTAPEDRFAGLVLLLLRSAGQALLLQSLPMVAAPAAGQARGDHVLLLPYPPEKPTLTMLAARHVAGWLNADEPSALADKLAAIQASLARCAPRGKNTPHLLRAARALDIPLTPVAGGCWQFGWGAQSHLMDSTYTSRTSVIGSGLARRKVHGAMVLRRAGLPVPEHELVQTEAKALEAAHRLGWPVVTKPNNSDGGRGVRTGIDNDADLRRGFAEALEHSAHVLVERHVEGDDFRLTVFHGRVEWVNWRQPGGVTGDGTHTVAELLDALNADPRRGADADAAMKAVTLDEEAQSLLQHQGLGAHSVPPAGQFVRLRRAANVSRGGTSVAANAGVHPDNLALAVQAAAAFGLDVAGVDLLIPDITRSWRDGGAAICEVNAQPQFGTNTQQHLHSQLLRTLTPGNGRIPVVVVAGKHAATHGQRLLAMLGVDTGIGLATRSGAWLAGIQLGQCADLFAACEALLFNRGTRSLLVQLEDEATTATGLPMDRIDLLWLSGALPAPGALQRLSDVLQARQFTVCDADDDECRQLAGNAASRHQPTPQLLAASDALARVAQILRAPHPPPTDADVFHAPPLSA